MGKTPPAIIVGFENNGLGVARALAKRGIECWAIAAPHWDPACLSRTARVIRCEEWTSACFVDTLVKLGNRIGVQCPLLVTKDEPVLWISESREQLKDHFYVDLPTPDTVNFLMNKQLFHDLAVSKRWPVPTTWRVNSAHDIDRLKDEFLFPCILKPAVKNSTFRLNSSKKAYILNSIDDMAHIYDIVSKWEPEVIIQEYVAGDDEQVAFCLGYWDEHSKPLAVFAGRKLRQFPPDCGNTALAEAAPAQWKDILTDLTCSIFEHCNHQGLGSIEYKFRLNSNEPVIMEPTVGRTNYQNEVAVLNGVNIPAISYWHQLGKEDMVKAEQRIANAQHPARKWIDTKADRAAAKYYIEQGRLTVEQWQLSISGPKDDVLWRNNDPLPWVGSKLAQVYGRARSALGRMVRR